MKEGLQKVYHKKCEEYGDNGENENPNIEKPQTNN
jgi:hypothetical protein